MRIEVLVNPVAGRRRFRFLGATLDALRARAGAVRVHETRWPGDAESYAREAAARPDIDRLIVAGGDGTIQEAVNGLAGATLPLGVVPLGTANVLAHELGLPWRPAPLAAILAGDATRRVATGLATPATGSPRRFVMMASVGLDAETVAGVDPRLKRALGKAAYALTALRLAATRPHARYDVVFEDGRREAGAAIVANGRRYGGPFVIAPAARLDAPELFVVTVGDGAFAMQLRSAAALVLGRLPRLAGVAIASARRVVLAGPAGAPLQADGEAIGVLPATIEILPDSLTLVFPP